LTALYSIFPADLLIKQKVEEGICITKHTTSSVTPTICRDTPWYLPVCRIRFDEATKETFWSGQFEKKFTNKSVPNQKDEDRFQLLAKKWKNETKHLSSLSQIIINKFYQQIIGMGQLALPFIFRELQIEPNHWFWALECITGEDVILANEDVGDMRKMAALWIQWGKEHGYLS
jgi:hypothetical protein